MTRILRFGITGLIGFVVDAAVLVYLLGHSAFTPATARCVSFPVALIVTWLVNRSWSFADRAKPRIGADMAGYVAVQVLGFLVNYAVYLALASGYPTAGIAPVLALAIGSATSALLTFILLNSWHYAGRQGAEKDKF
jgi:putative flippase GtrA